MKSESLFLDSNGYEHLNLYISEMKYQKYTSALPKYRNRKIKIVVQDKIEDFRHKIKPELNFTITYIDHLTKCCQSGILESKIQKIFSVSQALNNLKIAEFVFPLKVVLLQFLYHVHLNCATHSAHPKPLKNVQLWNALVSILTADLEGLDQVDKFTTACGDIDNSYEEYIYTCVFPIATLFFD